ncbi:MAG: HepT-like ribonuclease domain-containing protein [Pseudomonadota bacterium]
MNKKISNKDDVVNRLLKERDRLVFYGVISIGIFGSFAQSEQNSFSDVDILLKFTPEKHTFDNFMDVSFILEELLGRKVEVVTPDGLSPYIGPHILKEAELLSLSYHEYILHMLDEIDFVLSQVSETDYESFLNNATLNRAFVRSLEIIGDASKRLPENIKAMQPEIEWRKVSGMQDRLIHNYVGVDYTIVWDVAANKLPALRTKLQALLNENK